MIDPSSGCTSASDHAPDVFLLEIAREARRHAAVQHPWLQGFVRSESDPESVRANLRAFARAHVGFVAWFPAMLETVSRRCSEPRDRETLAQVLEIERGEQLQDSRRAMFARFCAALGLEPSELRKVPPHAAHWRSSVQRELSRSPGAFGVGLLGPGHLDIASAIHSHVIAACDRFTSLTDNDTAFFRTSIPDGTDPQQRLLAAVAQRLAASRDGREHIRRGMLFGLEARAQVWDSLTAR